MNSETLIKKIEDTENPGYAYLTAIDGKYQEDFLALTAENVANYLGTHMYDAKKIVITDIFDCLVLDTFGGFINRCPDQGFCREVVGYLAPIQMGEKEPSELLCVSRYEAEKYYQQEEN